MGKTCDRVTIERVTIETGEKKFVIRGYGDDLEEFPRKAIAPTEEIALELVGDFLASDNDLQNNESEDLNRAKAFADELTDVCLKHLKEGCKICRDRQRTKMKDLGPQRVVVNGKVFYE